MVLSVYEHGMEWPPRRSSRIVLVAAVATASDLTRVCGTAGCCLARSKLVEAAVWRDIDGTEVGSGMLCREIEGMSDMAEGKQGPRRSQDGHDVEQSCEKKARTAQQVSDRRTDKDDAKSGRRRAQGLSFLLPRSEMSPVVNQPHRKVVQTTERLQGAE